MKKTRWILPAAIFVLAGCSDTSKDVFGPAAQRPQAAIVGCGDFAVCPVTNHLTPITLGKTELAGIVLLGSSDFVADRVGLVSFRVSDTIPPAPPGPGSLALFLLRGGLPALHTLNVMLLNAGFRTSDTIPPAPAPPSPFAVRGIVLQQFVGDVNGDGIKDLVVGVTVKDLQRRGFSTLTTRLDITTQSVVRGAKAQTFSMTVHSDTIPPGPPPVGSAL